MAYFYHKLSYSVNTLGAEVVEGNYQSDYEYEQIMPEADGDAAIAYEGDVGVICAAEGQNRLYLAGKNTIEQMAFGAGDSEPFYEADFGENMTVYAMEEDVEQGLYALLLQRDEDNYAGGKILHMDKNGGLLSEMELPGYIAYDIAVDSAGRLYVETYDTVYVYDDAGNEVCALEITYSLQNGSLCRGKDGKVYTFNLGDDFVRKVMEVYEAPLPWENAEFMVLEDGRIVFVKYFDCTIGEGNNPEILPVPESVRICYVNCTEEGDKVSFERSNDMIFDCYVTALRLFTEFYYRSYEEALSALDSFSVKNSAGQEKIILSQGTDMADVDRYVVKTVGISGITFFSDLETDIEWQEGTTDCIHDFVITCGDKEYVYHVEYHIVLLFCRDRLICEKFLFGHVREDFLSKIITHYWR